MPSSTYTRKSEDRRIDGAHAYRRQARLWAIENQVASKIQRASALTGR